MANGEKLLDLVSNCPVSGDLVFADGKKLVTGLVTGLVNTATEDTSEKLQITLSTKAGDLKLTLTDEVIKLLNEYGELIDLKPIGALLTNYDGTTSSLEKIIGEITAQNLQKLEGSNVDLSVFGDEVRDIVFQLEKAMIGGDKSVGKFVALKVGNGFTKALYRFLAKIKLFPDVVKIITGTRNLLVSSKTKIDGYLNKLDGLREKSETEIKELLTNYVLYNLLILLISNRLDELNELVILNKKQELEKNILLIRLTTLSTIKESIPGIILMNHTAVNNVGITNASLSGKFDELVMQLGALISTIETINTIKEAQNLAGLLGELNKVSLLATFNSFKELLDKMQDFYKEEKNALVKAKALKGLVELEISESEGKLITLKAELLEEIGNTGTIPEV